MLVDCWLMMVYVKSKVSDLQKQHRREWRGRGQSSWWSQRSKDFSERENRNISSTEWKVWIDRKSQSSRCLTLSSKCEVMFFRYQWWEEAALLFIYTLMLGESRLLVWQNVMVFVYDLLCVWEDDCELHLKIWPCNLSCLSEIIPLLFD